MWLRRTGRGICTYRKGSFPIANDPCLCLCVCLLKWQFISAGLRNYFDTCGLGSKRSRPAAKAPPYLSAARQEPSPTSGHLTSRQAALSTRTRKFPRHSGCARLGSEVAPPLGVVIEEVAVPIVLVRRHRRAVGAAVRRAVDDGVSGAAEEETGPAAMRRVPPGLLDALPVHAFGALGHPPKRLAHPRSPIPPL